MFPGARKSVRLAPMDPSVPSTVTVRMGPSVTTSTERVCVIQDLKGLTARTGSVLQDYTVSSVTDTVPVTPPTHSGETRYLTSIDCSRMITAVLTKNNGLGMHFCTIMVMSSYSADFFTNLIVKANIGCLISHAVFLHLDYLVHNQMLTYN